MTTPLRSRSAVFIVVILAPLAGCFADREEPAALDSYLAPWATDEPVQDWEAHANVSQFLTTDLRTGEHITRPWAVYTKEMGGNCCEHYLATSKEGWITNIGGEYPVWTEDRGHTWQTWTPDWIQDSSCRTPMFTVPENEGLGEGSIVQATNGDLIAMSWFPYPGIDGKMDRFYAMLYDDAQKAWRWCYNRITEPFYDRSWQVEVVGPISSSYGSGPWASLVISNYWHQVRNGGGQISVDGLNYYPLEFPDPSDTSLDGVTRDFNFSGLGQPWDHTRPHREMRAMPIPDGGLYFPAYFNDGAGAFLDTNLVWNRWDHPSGWTANSTYMTLDSAGRVHNVWSEGGSMYHALSLDGGYEWRTIQITLPNVDAVEEWDFAADGDRDLCVFSVRFQATDGFDKDLVYHAFGCSDDHTPDMLTWIGEGNIDSTSGAGEDIRFDFASLAVLPDGGVVTAFHDATDPDPLFALELAMPANESA